MPGDPSRRQILASAGAMALTAMLHGRPQAPPAAMPTIAFGRTGRTLPRLGLGAFEIGNVGDVETALRVVRRALDGGVRYFDTAPSYGNGRSEERLGRALAEAIAQGAVQREELFIATKTLHRDAAGARRELEESLARLRVQ